MLDNVSMAYWVDLTLPFGRSTMFDVEIIVPAMGVNASFWRDQFMRSVDCYFLHEYQCDHFVGVNCLTV